MKKFRKSENHKSQSTPDTERKSERMGTNTPERITKQLSKRHEVMCS